MSNDNVLTFHGHVGTPVAIREGSAVPWVLFRVASTPSHWDQASRSWRELPTTWLSIKAFRQLAQNAAESLKVGDPVVVIGRLRTETWTTKEGEARESTVVEATLIAHDLGRGVTAFRKVDRQAAAAPGSDGTAEALAELEGQTSAA
ncbi:MAG: single-stranded DNA-binding protein [Aeromicrobium sp.]|jgi:single-strand DNA-binding protein|uniref:single-stranded DNA-binding protein n=1 Tax=Aeromicrobium sp. TaxID=1871063 RepID=UPI0026117D51|nr:single-stranded DNA-binding protein [Aeromicrobium sp.]MCW2823132.1 single-stranded DNA-binding protein [Aeromicrobium sp.]